ncbi:MAG: hypothetical protein LBK99_02625, partial [Opitutaceae bacterium]|nr:hypothetical protein [Opitutaceae bacterium]
MIPTSPPSPPPSLRAVSVFPCAVLLWIWVATVPLVAATGGSLLEENWAQYADGDTPAGSWTIWSGNPPESIGTVKIVEQGSPFGATGKSVLLKGNNPNGAGPALSRKFAPVSTPVTVRFDYHIPSSPGAGILPSMELVDSGGKPGPRLNLANNFLAPNHALNIANQGLKWDAGDIITPFRFNTWYHVEITTIPSLSGKWKYDVTITPFGGTPITVKNLEFAGDIQNIAGIGFSWNSTNPNGAIYV